MGLSACSKPRPLIEGLWTIYSGFSLGTYDQNETSQSLTRFFLASGFQFSSVQFSHSVLSDSLRPHESQHARLQSSSLWSREKGGFSSGIHKYSSPSGKLHLFKPRRHVFFQSQKGGIGWVGSDTHIHFFLDGPLLSNLINTGQRTCCSRSRSQELRLGTEPCIPDQCTCPQG